MKQGSNKVSSAPFLTTLPAERAASNLALLQVYAAPHERGPIETQCVQPFWHSKTAKLYIITANKLIDYFIFVFVYLGKSEGSLLLPHTALYLTEFVRGSPIISHITTNFPSR